MRQSMRQTIKSTEGEFLISLLGHAEGFISSNFLDISEISILS